MAERTPIVIVTIAVDGQGNLTYTHNVPLAEAIGLLQHTLALAEADWKRERESNGRSA